MLKNLTPAKKPIIAVDIDDVISTNAQSFVEYSNEKWGTHLTVDDYQEHWAEMWGIEHEEVERRAREYHESGHIGTYRTVDGAKEALQKLKERFKLVILTTRRNSTNQLTKDWIDRCYPGIFDEIIFSGFYDTLIQGNFKKTKGELAKSIGANYIIDDQLKHIQAAAELGIQGVLFGDYAWNKAEILPENVTRARNWDDVLKHFESKAS